MNIAPELPQVLGETDRSPDRLPLWLVPGDVETGRTSYVLSVAVGGLITLVCLVVFALAAAQA